MVFTVEERGYGEWRIWRPDAVDGGDIGIGGLSTVTKLFKQ